MNMLGELNLVAILVALAIVIVVFLIVREVLCWYWKVNQAISLLTEIRDLLASRGYASPSGGARPGQSGLVQLGEQREPTL